MVQVFDFWIDIISTCVNFLFTLKINENPDITLGMFLLACAFIGVIIYLILGTDFFPGHINLSSNSNSNNNNQIPRHAPGNAGRDFSTRESRHRY